APARSGGIPRNDRPEGPNSGKQNPGKQGTGGTPGRGSEERIGEGLAGSTAASVSPPSVARRADLSRWLRFAPGGAGIVSTECPSPRSSRGSRPTERAERSRTPSRSRDG